LEAPPVVLPAALAKAVLAQRAGMRPALRLLIELAGILGVTPDISEL
jgi:hypothetical protein